MILVARLGKFALESLLFLDFLPLVDFLGVMWELLVSIPSLSESVLDSEPRLTCSFSGSFSFGVSSVLGGSGVGSSFPFSFGSSSWTSSTSMLFPEDEDSL